MNPQKIAIVGIGLIGGSLGLALKERFPSCEVIGLSRSVAKVKRAKQRGAIDWGSTHPRRVLREADVVFICTPVSKICFWITQSEKWAKPGTVVTDVGSTKREIVRWVENRKFRHICFVGAHPMAGSHETGIEFARHDLFGGSLTFICRTSRTEPRALRVVAGLWKKISKKVIVLIPARHDRIVAEISHTPHALASLLVVAVSRSFSPFVSTGFLDTTRIAQGDSLLWRNIFISNRIFIARVLRKEKKALEKLIRDLEKGNSWGIGRFLSKASSIRRRWNPKN